MTLNHIKTSKSLLLLSSYLPVPVRNPLIGGQFTESDRPARVEFPRRDAHLGSKPEGSAVMKSRRTVHKHSRRVYSVNEGFNDFVILRHNPFGMSVGVRSDERNRLINIFDDFDGGDVVEKFSGIVGLRCFCNRSQLLSLSVPTHLDTRVLKCLYQPGNEFLRDVLMNQDGIERIAGGRPIHFCIDANLYRFRKV